MRLPKTVLGFIRNNIKLIAIVLTLVVLLVLAYTLYFQSINPNPNNNPPPIYNVKIDHVVIIVDENRSLSQLVNNPKAPYINQLVKSGAVATNYQGVSKDPYIALTSGSNTNIPNNCNPEKVKCQTKVANITDEIEASGRSWKMYAESMPVSCDFKDTKKYAVRHNPFMYYPSINSNTSQCSSQIVPYSNLQNDLNDSSLPNYVFISPNLCNDMHNCPIATGDKWLSQNVPKILSSQHFTKQHSLLILTWDEGTRQDSKVLTLFLGPAAKAGYSSSEAHNHYSILRTIEYVWKLKPLTRNDKNATLMEEMLK